MADTLNYKCPNCGGELKFDSDKQKMFCVFCDSEFEVSEFAAKDEELDTAKPKEKPEWQEGEQDGMFIYQCSHCGGEVVGDDTLAATTCPFCDMPVVLKSQFRGDLKPEYVIPFKIKKDEAVARLAQFCKGKKLLPKSFLENNRIESIKGLYVPFWLFDCNADANMTYEATRTSTWSDASYIYTKTDYYEICREGSIAFDNIPIDGASKMDDAYMESIEPYNYDDMVEFQSAYLAGYLADKYDVDVAASTPRAEARIDASVKKMFSDTVKGFGSKRLVSSNINHKYGDKSYALLPVWILSTRYNNEIYTYAMNGQTGKFIGRLPIDKGKARAYLLSIMSGIGLVAGLIASFIFL